MNLIEKAVVAGIAAYILLMAAEIISHPAVLAGAVIGAVLLGIVASVFLSTREHAVMILVWAMILLFVLYGVLCWFGVIPWT